MPKDVDPDGKPGGGFDDLSVQKDVADVYAKNNPVPWNLSTQEVAEKALREEWANNPIVKKKPPSDRGR